MSLRSALSQARSWRPFPPGVLYAGLGLLLAHTLVLLLLFRLTRNTASAAVAMPFIALAAWRTGVRGGLLWVVLLSVSTHLVFHLHGAPLNLGNSGRWLGQTAQLFLAVLVGSFSHLHHRLGKELEARRELESSLRLHQEHLEEQIQARTLALQDAQARNQTADRLQALGQLAGGVAHDFNNQLTVIQGHADLLEAKLQDPDQLKHLQRMQEASRSAGDLVRSLLSFTRQGRVRTEVVDLHTLLKEVRNLAAPTLHRRITLDTHLDARAFHVNGDSGQLLNALLNLVLNARDAIQDRGSITLRTLNEGQGPQPSLRLEVMDDGCGIPESLLERVFEPFFTTKPEGLGTGLGLAAVQGTVLSHGGTVDVHSAPGQGTTFTLHLPTVPSPVLPAPVLPPRASFLQPPRILVVDDEEEVGAVTQSLLELAGALVVRYVAPQPALARLAEEPEAFDVALVDMHMPHMNGAETMSALRAIRPDLPVVILSGYLQDGVRALLVAQGVSAILPKPCTLEELVTKLTRAMSEEGGVTRV